MLRRLQEVLESGKLTDFWHEHNNLLDRIIPEHLKDLANELKRIINCIETNIQYKPRILKTYFS